MLHVIHAHTLLSLGGKCTKELIRKTFGISSLINLLNAYSCTTNEDKSAQSSLPNSKKKALPLKTLHWRNHAMHLHCLWTFCATSLFKKSTRLILLRVVLCRFLTILDLDHILSFFSLMLSLFYCSVLL